MKAGKFATIEEAIATIKAGKMIILMEVAERENEGDLVIAAEFADSSAVNATGRITA